MMILKFILIEVYDFWWDFINILILVFFRGQVYYGVGYGEYFFDIINLMGIFKFLCDDYIVIRFIGDLKLVYINIEVFYFGVVQINLVCLLLYGDYSCNF